jgi:hypothetical protein
MIQAKAENPDVVASYRSHMYDVFDEVFYSSGSNANDDILTQEFYFGIDDPVAPHFPIPIFEDERYRLFDPLTNRSQLTSELYGPCFGPFIQFCLERLQLEEELGS